MECKIRQALRARPLRRRFVFRYLSREWDALDRTNGQDLQRSCRFHFTLAASLWWTSFLFQEARQQSWNETKVTIKKPIGIKANGENMNTERSRLDDYRFVIKVRRGTRTLGPSGQCINRVCIDWQLDIFLLARLNQTAAPRDLLPTGSLSSGPVAISPVDCLLDVLTWRRRNRNEAYTRGSFAFSCLLLLARSLWWIYYLEKQGLCMFSFLPFIFFLAKPSWSTDVSAGGRWRDRTIHHLAIWSASRVCQRYARSTMQI